MWYDVPSVYSSIATHFSETRVSHWANVKEFILSLPKHASVLDVGCGNGKYASVRKDLSYIGTDITPELLSYCTTDCFKANCLQPLPVRHASMDAVICIAVIHHFPTYEQRLQTLLQLFQCLRADGRVLVSVWAYEQSNTKRRDEKWQRIDDALTDYWIPWTNKYTHQVHKRYYHLFAEQEVRQLVHDMGYEAHVSFDSDNWVIEFTNRM